MHFDWLKSFGLTEEELRRLLPAVPGGSTDDRCYYVNTLLPDMIFKGRTYGTIPLTPGRWFLIPLEIVESHSRIREAAKPLATVRSAFPTDGPRSFQEWTAGG